MPGARIDCLQYPLPSEKIFRQMQAGGMHAVHVTITYHESFSETARNIIAWNRQFHRYPDLIFPGRDGDDVRRAAAENKTAIFFGAQNPSLIGDDIGLVELCHTLGVRFMQLSYNNQSLLACGYGEAEDSGISRFGRQVISEMNRLGMVIDMSHSGERSTLEAIEQSARPVAVTHANPAGWYPAAGRNKSDAVLKAIADSGGMFGFSLYPRHLRGDSRCTRDDFCRMVADTVSRYGIDSFGIGSDLCQDQPDSVVAWMRAGRWQPPGEQGGDAIFPKPLTWFQDNRDFRGIAVGLESVGFSAAETDALLGDNWQRFFDRSFTVA